MQAFRRKKTALVYLVLVQEGAGAGAHLAHDALPGVAVRHHRLLHAPFRLLIKTPRASRSEKRKTLSLMALHRREEPPPPHKWRVEMGQHSAAASK